MSVHRTAVSAVEDGRGAARTARAEGRRSILLLVDRAGRRSVVPVPLGEG